MATSNKGDPGNGKGTAKKKYFHPKLTKEAGEKLKRFYLDLRNNDAPNPVTVRDYDSLLRLAEDSARRKSSNEVTVEDANNALICHVVMSKRSWTHDEKKKYKKRLEILGVNSENSAKERNPQKATLKDVHNAINSWKRKRK